MPWSLALIEKYEDKWDWSGLSRNKALPWTLALIEQYEDKWDWNRLSRNGALPWSLALIEQYKDKWRWGMWGLSWNQALPWSLALIEQFKDQWYWWRLCNSAVACLPKLSIQNIEEVMNHHFPSESLRPTWDEDEDYPF